MSTCPNTNQTSRITSVLFEERDLIGGISTGTIRTLTDITDPFSYTIDLPSDVPHIENVRLSISNTSECGIDSNEVFYGGSFTVNINDIQPVSWAVGLSQTQLDIIKNSISLSRVSGKDIFDISITNIVTAGVQYFGLILPYKEQNIILQSGTITTDFLRINTTNSDLSQFVLTIDKNNDILSIDGGDIGSDFQVMRLEDISTSSRNIEESVEVTTSSLLITCSEDLTGKNVIYLNDGWIVNSSFPTTGYNTRVNTTATDSYITIDFARKLISNYIMGTIGVDGISQSDLDTKYTTLSISSTVNNSLTVSVNFAGMNDVQMFTINDASIPFRVILDASSVPKVLTVIRRFPLGDVSYPINIPNTIALSDFVSLINSTLSGTSMRANMLSYKSLKHTVTDYLTNSLNLSSVGGVVTITGNLPSKNFVKSFDYNDNNDANAIIGSLFAAIQSHDEDLVGTCVYWDIDADLLNPARFVCSRHIDSGSWNLKTYLNSTIELRGSIDWISYGTTTGPKTFTFSSLNSPIISDLINEINDWGSGSYMRLSASTLYYDNQNCTIIKNGSSSTTGTTGPTSYYIEGEGTISNDKTYTLSSYTISGLSSQINTDYNGLISSSAINHSNELSSILLALATTSISPNGTILNGHAANYFQNSTALHGNTIAYISNWINTICNSHGITSSVITDPLRQSSQLDDFNSDINLTTTVLTGQVPRDNTTIPPQHNIQIYCHIPWRTAPTNNDTAGLQVAFGGYEKNGIFYPNNAPNSFYEPSYNVMDPIEFAANNADIFYLLIRTRQDIDGTSFSSNGAFGTFSNYETNYRGSAIYSNGSQNQPLIPFVATRSDQISAWYDASSFTPGGTPTVVAVPAVSNVIEVSIEDIGVYPPVATHLTLLNAPTEIDQFGFLALNRTNLSNSQTESKDSTVYGLVLDNRGAWDVLIAPEAHLLKSSESSFSYMNSSYKRTIYDDDESYNMSFYNSSTLPTEILNAISLSPVPNYPQVWVLKIEPGVKKYLKQLRDNAPPGSNNGCSIDVDIEVTGRISGTRGIARVTIFYDYTCVFDINLCDFYWNLTSPTKTHIPEIIQNNLNISYEPLVDCEGLNNAGSSGDNVNIDVLWLTRIRNIPTFANGTALLLLKSQYTSEIQSFFMPTVSELENVLFQTPDPLTETCPLLNSDIEVMKYLNREVLVVKNGTNEEYITDSQEISNRMLTESSYLLMKPAFQYPSNDKIKDCGNNELVVVGIGFVLKNWQNGLRNYAIVIGAHAELPNNVFAPPDINICFRYYYNQHES